MTRMRLGGPLAALACGVLAVACGSDDGSALAEGSKATKDASAPVPVSTALSVEQTVPVVISATGTFVPDEIFQVTPQIAGQVAETLVDVGDAVEAGRVLIRLDSRDLALRLAQAQASLQQAEAQAAQAQGDVKRQSALQAKGLVSQSDLDRLSTQAAVADAAVAQARAQVAIAQKALEDTTIRTSFSGYVSARPVAVGEYVTPASRVATVIRIQPIKLELQIPEAQAMKVRIGMNVRAEVAAYPAIAFNGTVSALNRAIDAASRAMTVEATFANTDARLTAGMFTSALVHLPLAERGVFVPGAALLTVANGTSYAVYAIEDDTARVRVVQPGEKQGDMVRIQSGLAPGTIVAVGRLDQLFDGAKVTKASAGQGAADTGR
jgi:RND family efflux transporter MFP subunit